MIFESFIILASSEAILSLQLESLSYGISNPNHLCAVFPNVNKIATIPGIAVDIAIYCSFLI